MPGTERPATWEEVISAVAKQHGIPPAVALSVARQESDLNPGAVSEKGARGIFQLMPTTATELGVDLNDPVQNITGGIRYLKQLNDKYQGDVGKTLMAYNGGAANVDAGTVSPEAQAYAASVMARVSQAVRTAATGKGRGPTQGAGSTGRSTGAGPVGRGGPAGPAVGTAGENPSTNDPVLAFAKSVGSTVDPRTPTGRVNIASGLASAAISAIPGGEVAAPLSGTIAPQIAPWIIRVLGPPIAAALGGGIERAVEQSIGTTPASATGPVETGALQGLYELGGQAFMWPLRRVARAFFAPRVGKVAEEALRERGVETTEAGRAAVSRVKQQAADRVESARLIAQADAAAARGRVQPTIEAASTEATARKLALREQSTAAADAAKRLAETRVADTELENAARITSVTNQYDAILNRPPSHAATAEAVGAVVNKGTRGEPKGAAQLALEMAGKRVKDATKDGPRVKLQPIQNALEHMREGMQPDELLPATEKQIPGMGFTTAALASASPNRLNDVAFKKAITELETAIATQEGAAVAHPLPKVLGLIQQAPEDMSFETAHKLKGLLDESVNWDAKARGTLQRLTKGVRVALRRQMSGYAPYDEATAAYAQIVPLYEGKIGTQIIEAAQKNPDALMKLFDPEKPLQAAAARDLLIKQSAAGGDPAAGLRAWDTVRAAFTHNELIDGGIDGLAERVQKLVTQHPEFAKTVYHDAAGQQILTDLEQLGKAHAQAVAREAVETTAAKATRDVAVKAADVRSRRMIAEGTTRIGIAKNRVLADAAQTVREAADQGQVAVREVAREGAEAVGQERVSARAREAVVEDAKARLRASTVSRTRPLTNQAADIIHAASGTGKYFMIRGAIRLLSGPKANDILEWAAFSPQNTQRVSALLLGQLPDRTAAAVLRSMASAGEPTSRSQTNVRGPRRSEP